MIIEVHADMYMECRDIYISIYLSIYIYIRMKLGGSGVMPPQGKFEFLGEIMLHLRPFYTTQGQFSHSSKAFSIVIQ